MPRVYEYSSVTVTQHNVMLSRETKNTAKIGIYLIQMGLFPVMTSCNFLGFLHSPHNSCILTDNYAFNVSFHELRVSNQYFI